MPKNLVICFDGTSNQFSSNNTNIVRLVQAAKRDFDTQHVYYDPGVGTLPEPGWVTWLGKKISEIAGLAFGAGLAWKVQEAYCYLMDWWEPGDQVYLFGFSRGAYTARVLAGFLHEFGLLAHGASNMVPYALRLFATAPKDHDLGQTPDTSHYWKLRDEFRETFARPVKDVPTRRFPIHFMGLFDTVSSVGWVWDPPKFPFTTHNPSVQTVRHAVSIDERRWFFRQNLMVATGDQDLEQRWFPGTHSDVGGGYPEAESGLWRLTFEWMVSHARPAGLLIDEGELTKVLNASAASARPWTDEIHPSLHGLWWLAEFFPKLCRVPGQRWPVPRLGLGRYRTIAAGQKIQDAALHRIRDMDYAPANLSPKFRERVRGLSSVPEWLEYEP